MHLRSILVVSCGLGLAFVSGCAVAPPPDAPTPSSPSAAAPPAARSEEDAALDDRRIKTSPRPRAVLVSEVVRLSTLLATTPRTAPDRPALLRRIAETHEELAAASTQEGAATVARSAHHHAATTYDILLGEHPDAPARDAATYYAGLEYAALGDLAHARSRLLDVVKKHPDSPYVGKAYFAFGRFFRQEGKSDLASQAFASAKEHSEPGSAVHRLASQEVGDDPSVSPGSTTTSAPSGAKIVVESSLED